MTAALCPKGLHLMAFPNIRARPGKRDQCRACAAHHKPRKSHEKDPGGWRSRGWIRDERMGASVKRKRG